MKGFPAVKFHYSKKKQAECKIELTKDMKTLKWSYPNKMKKAGSVNLSQITGIIFGSFSSTFLSYRNVILDNMRRRVQLKVKETAAGED